MKLAIEYLREKEWSMGNGQCPECGGLSKEWLEDTIWSDVGHETECKLATALESLGEKVHWLDYE